MPHPEYILPKRARLVKGVRLLNPFTGTYYKYGGRWVHVKRWAESGQIIIAVKWSAVHLPMDLPPHWHALCFLVTPEQIGLKPYVGPEQARLFFQLLVP